MTWSPAPPKKNYTFIYNVPMVGNGIQTNVGPVEVATSKRYGAAIRNVGKMSMCHKSNKNCHFRR